jgi:methyl-accepting chemotaxis protein
MNKDIKDRILKLEKDVNEYGEAIRETTDTIDESMGNVLKVVKKILDDFGNEPPKNFNKIGTKILDNFESVLSQQKILIKIISQLSETTEKIHCILD